VTIDLTDGSFPAPPGPTPSLLDELMTAEQMAGTLQMRVSTVEDYARRGLLPSVKVGRHRRFIRSQVERAILDLGDADAHVENKS
jgi:excisionase family DNA binding protein